MEIKEASGALDRNPTLTCPGGTRPDASERRTHGPPFHGITTARTCLRGSRQRRSPHDATKLRNGGTVRSRARVSPNPAPQRHPFPTDPTCNYRSLRRHNRNVRPDRSGIPCRSTALTGHLPRGMTDRPGPGVAREWNQTFARPPRLPGKTPRPDRQPELPKAVKPEEAPVIPEDRSSAFTHHRPLRAGRLGSDFKAGVADVLSFPRALACR